MPTSLPRKEMRAALEAMGVERERHERRALRSLIHERTGMPPPDHRSADELAAMLLELEREKEGPHQ